MTQTLNPRQSPGRGCQKPFPARGQFSNGKRVTRDAPQASYLLQHSSVDINYPVSGFEFRVSEFGFRVSGFGFRAASFGSPVSGSGFPGSGFGFWFSGFGQKNLIELDSLEEVFLGLLQSRIRQARLDHHQQRPAKGAQNDFEGAK